MHRELPSGWTRSVRDKARLVEERCSAPGQYPSPSCELEPDCLDARRHLDADDPRFRRLPDHAHRAVALQMRAGDAGQLLHTLLAQRATASGA